MEGFEPPTTWFVARYSIQLSYTRKLFFKKYNQKISNILDYFLGYGARGRIRTSDHLVRSQVLYPAELHALNHFFPQNPMAEREGFEPSVRINVRFLSRELVSTTHPPLQNIDLNTYFGNFLHN